MQHELCRMRHATPFSAPLLHPSGAGLLQTQMTIQVMWVQLLRDREANVADLFDTVKETARTGTPQPKRLGLKAHASDAPNFQQRVTITTLSPL